MRVSNKKIVIFICLSIFIFGLFKLFNKKEIELDNVILDIQKQNNTFAIYVEEDKNKYNEKEIFPEEGYVLNEEKSQCMSIDGNIINNILSYDYENKKLIVDTTESISCYLYFDKGAGLEIIDMQPKGLNLDVTSNSDEWTGMYRFQGQQKDGIDNYICFGTSDSGECKEHPDKYMYRIIGIEESGRIKVIKKEALEKTDQWWTDNDTSKHWTDSKVYADINGTTFLNAKNYVPTGWENKIDTNHWLFGTMHSNNGLYGARQNGVEVYKIENNEKEAAWNEKATGPDDEYKGVKAQAFTAVDTNKGKVYYYISRKEKWNETGFPYEIDAKIGLMNISDYYLSISNTANCQQDNKTYENICNTGWMHLSQNDEKNSSQIEWTMTRYGWSRENGVYLINGVSNTGATYIYHMVREYPVRPVFYLKNNIKLIDGSGTETDPFII